jgi:quinoprotein glucose dehydrogenase
MNARLEARPKSWIIATIVAVILTVVPPVTAGRPELPTKPTALVLDTSGPLVDQGEFDPRLRGYFTPPGFRVQIAADFPAVVNPVTMSFADDGTLFVAEWLPGAERDDALKALTSSRGDGIFDKVKTLATDLRLPAGLLPHDGWLYVSEENAIWRARVDAQGLRAKTKEILIKGFKDNTLHHRLSGLALGPDGWLYISQGDADTDAEGRDGAKVKVARHGGVFRSRLDGSRLEVVAQGMRNPFGNIAFDSTLEIFHTDNDNEDGSKFQGCRLLHVVAGGDYGWRLLRGVRSGVPDFPRSAWFGERPGALGSMGDTGRGAPTGVAIIDSPAFPRSYQRTLVHPDVFQAVVRLFEVRAEGGTFRVTRTVPLLQVKGGPDEGLFRPSDAELGPDGALYVLDWRTYSGGSARMFGDALHGRIYRITWTGTKEEPARATTPWNGWRQIPTLGTQPLLERLAAPAFRDRLVAKQELARRGQTTRPAVLAYATDRHRPTEGRLFALLAAAEPWGKDVEGAALAIIKNAGEEPEPLVATAADLLGRFARPPVDWQADLRKLRGRALREVAAAYGKLHPADGHRTLLAPEMVAAVGNDPFVLHGVVRGLEAGGAEAVAALERLCLGRDRKLRDFGWWLLASLRHPEAPRALARVATAPGATQAERIQALTALRQGADPEVVRVLADWAYRQRRGLGPVRVALFDTLAVIADDYPEEVRTSSQRVLLATISGREPAPSAAALAVASKVRPTGIEHAIRALASDGRAQAALRIHAMRALAAFPSPKTADSVRRVLAAARDQDLRAESLRALGSVDAEEGATRALDLLSDKSSAVRRAAIALLTRKREHTVAMLDRAIQGRVHKDELPNMLATIRRNGDPEVTAKVGELVQVAFAGAQQDMAPLAKAVKELGDPTRGQMLYMQREKLGCIICHELEGHGGNVGPSLTGIWQTLTLEKIIESIMEPSKEIKEEYGAHDVALKDGRVVSGRLVGETDREVVIREGTGEEVRIPRAQVDKVLKSEVSLMPEGTTAHLTLTELASLLAFLKDRAAQEALRGDAGRQRPPKR